MYENLTVKELFTSIGDPYYITKLLYDGLAKDNDKLALPALEWLLNYGDIASIKWALSKAKAEGLLKPDHMTTNEVAERLVNLRGDPILRRMGIAIKHGELSDDVYSGEPLTHSETNSQAAGGWAMD